MTSSKRWIVVLVVVVILLTTSLLIFKGVGRSQNAVIPTPSPEPEVTAASSISDAEKQAIDAWIEDNDLNSYGDPKDSGYTGGTPLFNEATGEYIDKYEYIKNRHPDEPWNK